jgi:hypothetical protein
MRGWHRIAAAVLFVAPVFAASAGSDSAGVAAATYDPYSVSPPTPEIVFICHGFGCKYRTEVDLTAEDRARLAKLLAPGKASAAAERRAIAAAGAWFDRRIGPTVGTQDHVAAAGAKYMFNRRQFDCIDASRNTTSLLLIADELKLLWHHRIDAPQSRGLMIDGRPFHTTAVLVENGSGEKWAVDSWTRGYGQAPEVMPLDRWLEE